MRFLFLLLPLTAFLILFSNRISVLLFLFFLNLFVTGIIYFYLKLPLFGLLILFLYVGGILVFFVFLLPLLRIREGVKESFLKYVILLFSFIFIFFISMRLSKYFNLKVNTSVEIEKFSDFLIKDVIGFEFISFILLVVIIGAFLLVKDER